MKCVIRYMKRNCLIFETIYIAALFRCRQNENAGIGEIASG